MSEITDLTVLEIKPEQAPVLYAHNGLDPYLEQIRQSVNEVPDLSTKKGRDRVASLAARVSRSKTAIEKPGREYLKRLKEAVKPAEAELRRWVTECDTLRDKVRKPLTDWEAEQDRIKAEQQMLAWHDEALVINEAFDKALAEKIEADHELALLMNDKLDRDLAEDRTEAERQRVANEEELKRQAAEQAKREAEEKAERERAESVRREAELKFKAEQAERERKEAQERAEQQRLEALAKAERDKQDAIEAERQKAQEEAARIKRESDAKEAARLAEEKRIADENARRAADLDNRKKVNNEALCALLKIGVTEDMAKKIITAIAKHEIQNIQINY